MSAVLTALGTMGVVTFVGWLIGRLRILGPGSETVIAKLVFMVATPALLFSTIATADLSQLLTGAAAVTLISTVGIALAVALILRLVLRRSLGDVVIGTLSATYVNAGNLGLPLAVFLLGTAVAVVPTLLLQLLFLAPLSFVVLESRRSGTTGWRSLATSLGRSLRNPIIIAAACGLVAAMLPLQVPEWFLSPFEMVGRAAAPLALITLGMSLVRQPGSTTGRAPTPDLAIAVVCRSLIHPALAWALATAFGFDPAATFAVVAMAALPTAQNVLVFALRYDVGRAIARDSQLVTTALAVPLLILVAALLG